MQIIVDGSQLRLDPKDIQHYLNKGYIVTVTGSKFFRSSLCRCLNFTQNVTKLIHSATTPLPEGLTEYYNHSDWPAAGSLLNCLKIQLARTCVGMRL
jgi:hypothetical protein